MAEFEKHRFKNPNYSPRRLAAAGLLLFSNLAALACAPSPSVSPKAENSRVDAVGEMEAAKKRMPECVVNDPEVELKKMIGGVVLYKKHKVRAASMEEEVFDRYKATIVESLKVSGLALDRGRTGNSKDLAFAVAMAYVTTGTKVHGEAISRAPGVLRDELAEFASCFYISSHSIMDPYVAIELRARG